MDTIDIIGARSHNLQNVSLSIPQGKLVVVTGVSGSGKSSLAFDTLYAEGQRRYMDTLSTYARQYVGMLERPEVDDIRGLSPILAIEQKTTGRNPRSTIGTITEIYDFFRLLYARAAQAYSPATGAEMVRYSDEMIVNLIQQEYEGRKILLLSPLVQGRKGHYRDLFESLVKKGYNQVLVDDELCDLATLEPLDRYKVHFIYLVVDKLVPSEEGRSRTESSVRTALNLGKGSLSIMEYGQKTMRFLSKNYVCPDTGISYNVPAPHTFSFNSPQGACPHCGGLGKVVQMDSSKIIPDDSVSIADGGIAPLGEYRNNNLFAVVEAIAKKYDFSLKDPISEIPPEALSVLLYGSEELFRVGTGSEAQMVTFEGIIPRTFNSKSADSDETPATAEKFAQEMVCPVCGGTRLKKESLQFKIAGLNIAQVAAMDIDTLQGWVAALSAKLSERQNLIAAALLKEISARVGFLKDVGLGYLSLDRGTATLSGGESQRIRLATQIGSKLVNVLYILDEPSIGLHQRDNRKLIASLKALRDEGNSVLVVEHDREIMENADWLVDLGPGAGLLGGRLLYNGPVSEIPSAPSTPTTDYLMDRRSIEVPQVRRTGNGRKLVLRGARGNNLKDVTLEIPLGCLIGISGVSGSGKSSLVTETLMPILSNTFYNSMYPVLPYDTIEGIENIDKIIEIDQRPIGRSPRSNPATYTNVFTAIRELFEQTPDAKIRGFRANRFSFNNKGGRCEACKGAGVQEIEMKFLPPAHVTCKECHGRRYKPDVLAVRYKGKNISDVLEMNISEAAEFFSSNPFIYPKLKAMEDVGLGYIKLGQQSTTLSGGESQRVKLAAELARKSTGNTLYLLDEPTTGLHFDDIHNLMQVLQRLVDQGNTIIVVEHNLDVLKCVDYLVDMGPEGGTAGGNIVAQGTPEQVAACPGSYTGMYLAEILH
ncbi:MAG: excinuclease ABC subunit UvrA [Bacteroidales bacterium]|nr:excinuclease ABC subunit UvrA [Candidatus Equibacterium intestinale]